jgi:hypothetical protein
MLQIQNARAVAEGLAGFFARHPIDPGARESGEKALSITHGDDFAV